MERISEISQSNTLESVKETDSSNFTNEELEGTPFRIIGNGKKWKAVLGDYQVTEEFESKTALIKYIKSKSWMMLTTVISIIIEQINQLKEQQKEVEKQIDKLIE